MRNMGKRMPELLVGVPVPVLDAEQLRKLLDDDDECDSKNEALEHRLGDEIGDETELQETGDQEEKAEHNRDRRSKNDVLMLIAYYERRKGRGENRGRSGRRRHRELMAGSEDRVRQQT